MIYEFAIREEAFVKKYGFNSAMVEGRGHVHISIFFHKIFDII
jgi:hypothetical protein